MMEQLLEEVKVMSEPSLVFWIRQAVTNVGGDLPGFLKGDRKKNDNYNHSSIQA